MFYLIHRITKEHRVVPHLDILPNADWRYVEADADGWITWHGSGECPLPKDAQCEYRMTSDGPYIDIAGDLTWYFEDSTADITAYRPILDADEPAEPEAVEWDGEGLPPVGCECEINTRDGWMKCRIVYQDGDIAIGRIHDGQGTSSKCDWSRKGFRTPAQRAEDAAVEDMMRIYQANESISVRDAMCDLYRAGYRKKENAS